MLPGCAARQPLAVPLCLHLGAVMHGWYAAAYCRPSARCQVRPIVSIGLRMESPFPGRLWWQAFQEKVQCVGIGGAHRLK